MTMGETIDQLGKRPVTFEERPDDSLKEDSHPLYLYFWSSSFLSALVRPGVLLVP